LAIHRRRKKKPKPRISEADGAKDVPSWVKGEVPWIDENGKQFAKRLCDARHGKGKYPTGPGSEYSKIKKWGDRAFIVPD
jgi:hypothetical protein